MRLKVYCTHWSDNNRKWGKPRWIDKGSTELGLPFGYFLAKNLEKAEEFVKTLPPLWAVTKKGRFPEGFNLGHIEILWRPE